MIKMTKAALMEQRAKLQAEREALRTERKQMVDSAEAEKREMTTEEADKVEQIRSKISVLNAKIDEMTEQIEEPVAPTRGAEPSKPAGESDRPSLLRFFRDVARGQLSDESRQLNERGVAECRKAGVAPGSYVLPIVDARATIAVSTSGSHTVANELQTILDPLRQSLVMAQAGATVMTGCIGDVTVPAYSGSEAHWADEGAEATDSAGTFSSKTYKPRRLTAYLAVDEKFLLQDSVEAEGMLMRDLVACIATKLESSILGTGTKGLFNGVVANKGKASYDRFVDIEADIDTANALMGNLAYITTPKGKAILRKTPVVSSGYQGFLTDGKTLNEYKLLATTGCASDLNSGEQGIVFGNWLDMVIAQWGGINLIADNLTLAHKGLIRFIINSYWDFGFRRDESYKVSSIKA